MLANNDPLIDELMNNIQETIGMRYDWDGKATLNFVRLFSSFDVMDADGWCQGHVDFCIRIPKKNPIDFTIQYRNDRSRYLAGRYLVTEYLVDLVSDNMDRVLVKHPSLRISA